MAASDKHDSTQQDKFQELARDLQCDEDEKAFEEKVRRVAIRPAAQSSSGAPSSPVSKVEE